MQHIEHLKTREDKAEPGSQPDDPKPGKRAGGNAPRCDLWREWLRIRG